MASGNFSNFPVSDFGIYCEWTATPDVVGNFSTVTLNAYFSYWGPLYVSSRTDSIINVNNDWAYFSSPAISDSSSQYSGRIPFAQRIVKVPHDSNGNAQCYLGVSYRFGGTYAGVAIGAILAETTVQLDHIDRDAPAITASIANITQDSFLISASSPVVCDMWRYSLDGGASWNDFTAVSSSSVSQTVTGLQPNAEYLVQVQARRVYNHVLGVSTQSTAKTLGAAAIRGIGLFVADNDPAFFDLGFTVYSTDFSYSLSVADGDANLLTLPIPAQQSTGATTVRLQLTDAQRVSVLQALSGAKNAIFPFVLTTLNGSAIIGTSEKTAPILTTPANSSPIFDESTSLSWADSNPITAEATGDAQVLIQGYSLLSVTSPTAIAKNYASIVKYTATVDDTTVSAASTSIAYGKIPKSGTATLRVCAEDSRGYLCEACDEITVIPYARIVFDTWEIRRANEVDATTKLVFAGKISPLTVNGAKRNAVQSARFRYKKGASDSTEAWSDWVSMTGVIESGNAFAYSNSEFHSFDPDYGYTIEFDIADKIDHDTISVYLRPGRPLVSLRSKKVGINNATPQSALDVTGDIRMNGYNVMGVVASLDETADLNNLSENGIYIQALNENATAEHHYPAGKAGYLEVIGGLHRYTAYDCSGIYLRYKCENVWSAWKVIPIT